MNRENLESAKKFLDTVDYRIFGMEQFRNEGSATSHKCGTVGCIIGHCVMLTPMEIIDDKFRYEKKDSLFRGGDINFLAWSEWFFEISTDSNVWDYLFHTMWAEVPETNTIRHAQQRIQNILDGYEPTEIIFEVEKFK